MKVLIDTQIFNNQKFGGISRYHAEIFVELQKLGVEVEIPIIYSDNLHLKQLSLYQNFRNVIFNPVNLPKFINKRIAKKYKKDHLDQTLRLLQNGDFDIFVPTYYDPYFLNAIGDTPFILTVYDMIHEVLPQYFTRDKSTVPDKKRLMEKATKIIAISESTKNDIIQVYPHINAQKIEVVYLSYSIKKDSNVSLELPDKYVLFVGNRSDYKNFNFFLTAIAPLLHSDADLYLVCAGGNPFSSKERDLIRSLDVFDKLLQRNFEDNALSAYYSNAQCFVFPSEYEGFGIPVLESMACGCPVVLANHSSFPEVAGEAGIYFELNNADDLKAKIENLLQNESLRDIHRQKGFAQAEKFSWKKTAADCLKVFQSAIDETSKKTIA